MRTPSSASSSRRASISSVTSSGRWRKDQSLQDVAASLGQRTPERSQPSEEGAPPRSRQLDFGSVDDADVDDEQTQEEGGKAEAVDIQTHVEGQAGDGEEEEAAAVVVEEVKMPVQLLDVDREDEEVPSPESERADGDAADVRPIRGRRATVFWTEDEEEFLRQGVARYGIGKWKQILIDGAGVFSSHRTNVDLKDKWKNLQTPRQSSRKRRRAPGSLTPPAEREHAPVNRPAKRRAASNKSNEEPSAASVSPKPRRRAPAVAGRTVARVVKQNAVVKSLPGEVDEEHRVEVENSDVDERATRDHATTVSAEPAGSVELKIATNKSFPELVAVVVNLGSCQDVAALKSHLRATVLSDASAYTELQVIGLDSRMLFEDNERLSQCIRKNGPEFFVVLDESPEEFV